MSRGNTSTFLAFLPAADQAWEVPAVCIDILIEQACQLSPNGRGHLLKIDAEGAEYPTLLTAQQLHLVDEICGESHNNVPWHDELPGIAGLTNRLQELGFVVTHVDIRRCVGIVHPVRFSEHAHRPILSDPVQPLHSDRRMPVPRHAFRRARTG